MDAFFEWIKVLYPHLIQEEKGHRLGLKEWYMKRMVRGMSREEKQSMMEKMMEGMTAEDKQELMGSMMPAMMSQMFGGEGGMPSMMMQMMKSMIGGKREGEKRESPRMPVMETQEDFKPWEFCPCRKLCEKAFKKKSKS